MKIIVGLIVHKMSSGGVVMVGMNDSTAKMVRYNYEPTAVSRLEISTAKSFINDCEKFYLHSVSCVPSVPFLKRNSLITTRVYCWRCLSERSLSGHVDVIGVAVNMGSLRKAAL